MNINTYSYRNIKKKIMWLYAAAHCPYMVLIPCGVYCCLLTCFQCNTTTHCTTATIKHNCMCAGAACDAYRLPKMYRSSCHDKGHLYIYLMFLYYIFLIYRYPCLPLVTQIGKKRSGYDTAQGNSVPNTVVSE